jgi:predicted transcriptional regulator
MDWKALIAELQRLGHTQPQIAAVCGCGQATISDLAKGHTKEPRHSLGEALKSLLEQARAARADADGDGAQPPVAPDPEKVGA